METLTQAFIDYLDSYPISEPMVYCLCEAFSMNGYGWAISFDGGATAYSHVIRIGDRVYRREPRTFSVFDVYEIEYDDALDGCFESGCGCAFIREDEIEKEQCKVEYLSWLGV